ncbi:hypothetical protein P7C71_g4023, partial [Lecanoromycetidae sp. Uapishka_2]
MVLTHPELKAWHKDAIRKAVGEYGIGVIFVPLFKSDTEHDDELERQDDELPVLRPLDPRTISGFTNFDALRDAAGGVDDGKELDCGKGREASLEEEMVLKVDIGSNVEEIIEEVVRGVKDVMSS